ncbi:MAG: hypothetical protein KatS3mg110_4192 [Pirellulaceae bacterium]|nr:MAG: hypothetical protein KatS3mg110_4192 [Pirellulaceae bacterium]
MEIDAVASWFASLDGRQPEKCPKKVNRTDRPVSTTEPRTGRWGWQDRLLLAGALVLPLLFGLAYYFLPLGRQPVPVKLDASRFDPSTIPFTSRSLAPSLTGDPRITHVRFCDLDQDGLMDVLVCDAFAHRVLWIRQGPSNRWEERVVGTERSVLAPGHAEAIDLDRDGDLDILVAGLGSLWPTDDAVGSVAWLENVDNQRFVPHLLLQDLRRVTDVQAADFDNDRDLDLVVAEFGYHRGSIFWMENLGEGRFRDRLLMAVPGTVHVPVADWDGDGDPDFAAVVTQNEEEVWGFENLGGGQFQRRLLASTINFDFGGVGLVRCDLDLDGRPDMLWVAGDNYELLSHHPQPSHGCVWLRNEGNWNFSSRRLVTFGGTYGAAVGDLDGNGLPDVVLVSMFNNWRDRQAASIIWLQNAGGGRFVPWQISSHPIQLATVDCADVDGDGRAEFVVGGAHITKPNEPLAHLLLWRAEGGPTTTGAGR